jgi:hypothetical protein
MVKDTVLVPSQTEVASSDHLGTRDAETWYGDDLGNDKGRDERGGAASESSKVVAVVMGRVMLDVAVSQSMASQSGTLFGPVVAPKGKARSIIHWQHHRKSGKKKCKKIMSAVGFEPTQVSL